MKKKILIVDDDKTLRDLLEKNLKKENYDVYTAQDGNTALRLCREKQPDLILLDIKLPDMLGGRCG